MGSLGGCFKRFGITGQEATYIRGLAQNYRKDGFDARESNLQAVDELIANMETERQSIINQIITLKPELKSVIDPVANPTENALSMQEMPGNAQFPKPRQPMPQSAWQETQPGQLDYLRRKLQDKSIDLKRIVEAIQDAGLHVPDELNPIFREEMYAKRTEQRTTDFAKKELEPLIKQMQAHGVTLKQINDYLHARHVITDKVNERLQQLNPDMAGKPDYDKLAGITNQEARGILAQADKTVMEPLARAVDKMVERTRDLMVEYGIESQETIDRWRAQYKSYAPLQREGFEDEGMRSGGGFSVRGSSVSDRLGSGLKVVDVLANIAQARDQVIERGEKLRPTVALAGLLMKYPNLEFAQLDQYSPITYDDPVTGLPITIPGNLSQYQRPMIRRKNPLTGESTFYPDPTYKSRDNVVNFRIKGKDFAIVFNDKNERAVEVAKGLKNLDTPQLNGLLKAVAPYTRYLAAVNTQFNPIFGLVNFVRDVQFAMIALQSTELKGAHAEVLKNVKSMMGGIFEDARAVRQGGVGSSPAARLWKEFEDAGGPTGYRDLFFSSSERAEELQRMLTPERWNQIRSPQQFARVMEKTALFKMLSDYNLVMENSIRLAVYKTARDHGMSSLKAASYAKNITVNFNRKGQLGAQIGSLYAFFGANVQGTVRLIETMTERKGDGYVFSSVGKQIVTGGILLGILQTLGLSLAGFEDDEPPEYVKEKNLVIPAIGTDKGYVQIPMPLGFNLLPTMGRLAAETLYAGLSGRPPKAAERGMAFLGSVLNTFNPLGGTDAIQTAVPTVADPLVALDRNKDWTGKPIYQEDMNRLKPTPGHTRAHDSATPWAIGLSRMLNWATGGTDYVPSKIASPSPDAIDYLFGQATGGVGRELTKFGQSGRSLLSGEDLPANRIPVAGRFIGSSTGKAGLQDRFYQNIRDINAAAMEIEGRLQNREDASDFIREHPEANLKSTALAMQKHLGDLREEKHRLVSTGAPKEAVQRIEHQITNVMTMFNTQAERIRETAK